MTRNASGGVLDCMFIKQRPCGPLARAFFEKGKKQEKGYHNTSRASEQSQSTIYTQDPQLQGGSDCLLTFLQPLPKQIASVLQSLPLVLRQTLQPVWERAAML